MLSQSLVALAVGFLVTRASAALIPASQISKRWDMTLCTPENSLVPIPDADNFQLPLENLRQDMCWDFCVGDQAACTTKTKICWNFQGSNLIFDFKAAPGYTYTEATIWLDETAPATTTPTPKFTTSNSFCTIAADASTVHCIIPYSSLTTNPNILQGMCPYGDRDALVWFLFTNAKLVETASGTVLPGAGRLSCMDYPTCTQYYPSTYWKLTYRCTKCPVVPPPPPPPPTYVEEFCSFGTAFGYSTANPKSLTLNSYTPLPNTCKRWGWYTTPTTAQLSTGFSGILYVGAGQNDISKAANVGTWSASIVAAKIVISFGLTARYQLAQVHVDVGCLPFPTCAPGKYKYVKEDFTNAVVATSFQTPGIAMPSCGSKALYIIVHASVNTVQTIPAASAGSFVCASPGAT